MNANEKSEMSLMKSKSVGIDRSLYFELSRLVAYLDQANKGSVSIPKELVSEAKQTLRRAKSEQAKK